MARRVSLAGVCFFFTISAWATKPLFSGEEWNVFGKDDRVPITSTQYPWSTIGKVGRGCTGTLVGDDLVLTAAHCVLDDVGKIDKKVTRFYPNWIDGEAPEEAGFIIASIGTYDPKTSRGSDWALLRLDKKLGKSYGWMGVDSHTPTKFNVAGYSGNFLQGQTAGVHMNCEAKKVFAETFYHDCDSARGASGGPIFVIRKGLSYIVGLVVAEKRDGKDKTMTLPEYEDAHANVGLLAAGFITKIKQLR